jgi:hypothetical protein
MGQNLIIQKLSFYKNLTKLIIKIIKIFES